jgi:Flp pilus assembly protein TadG
MGACRNKLRQERGVIFILFIVVLLVLLAFAALALDVGNVMVVRNELQNIGDGAALAGARYLGRAYEGMSYSDQQDPAKIAPYGAGIISTAQDVGTSNRAEGIANVNILASDIELGQWDRTKTPQFQPTAPPWDAVRVTVRKDGNANTSVVTYFARLFGMNTIDVSASAVAALTAESSIEPGNLIPVGIDADWWTTDRCGNSLKFYPQESCAAWNVYDASMCQGNQRSENAECLWRRILYAWATNNFDNNPTNDFIAPGADLDSTFYFTEGVQQKAVDNFTLLWDQMKKWDPERGQYVWIAQAVVFESNGCTPITGARKIVGFTTVVITGVDHGEIVGTVLCDLYKPSAGGGGEYGTKGTIPGLVK